MGADLGGGDRPEVGQPLRLAAMPLQKGEIAPADAAIGLQGVRSQAAFVGQVFQPGRQGLIRGQLRSVLPPGR